MQLGISTRSVGMLDKEHIATVSGLFHIGHRSLGCDALQESRRFERAPATSAVTAKADIRLPCNI
jgi:hypothetical protein